MWKFPLNLCLVPSWSNHQLCAQLWIISQLFHSQTALNKEKWKYCRFFLFLLFSFQFHKYIYLSINSFWVIWTCFTSSFCSLGGLSTSGIKSLPLPHPSHVLSSFPVLSPLPTSATSMGRSANFCSLSVLSPSYFSYTLLVSNFINKSKFS